MTAGTMHYRPEQVKHGAYTTEPPSFLRMVLLALALFALAIPIVGPLDDHHFAERSHTHQHLYMDGRPVQHRHLLESGSPHRHAGQHNVPAYDSGWPQPDGVAYLTDTTSSLMLAALNAPLHNAPEALRPASLRGKNSNLLAPFAARHWQPEEHRVAPPQPPPIA